MSLRTNLIAMGCLGLALQFALCLGFLSWLVNPRFTQLEKVLVEKNLNLGMGLIQHELANLEKISSLLAETQPLQNYININNLDTSSLNSRVLQEKMLHYEINLIYILDNNHKVLWDQILDLNTENPYPKQHFLTRLWEKRSTFFEHTTANSLHSGLFNSALGPLFVVSVPILSPNTGQVQGSLICAKLITEDLLHLLENISDTNLKIWPLGGSTLDSKQLKIIEQIAQSDSDSIILENNGVFRGYMALPDIDQQLAFLLSSSRPIEIIKLTEPEMIKTILFSLGSQGLFLGVVYLLLVKQLFLPIRKLRNNLHTQETDWHPLLQTEHQNEEIANLSADLSKVILHYQERLAQETILAYKDGCEEALSIFVVELEHIIRPLVDSLENIQQKLTNLPLNAIEKIVADGKSAITSISPETLALYIDQLQEINGVLRHFQTESRLRLYELCSKTLRSTALLRTQARNYSALKRFSPHTRLGDKNKASISGP